MPKKKNKMSVHFSSATDLWATPQKTFNELNEKYGPFQLDVCATDENAKCAAYFTESTDGLKADWNIAPEGNTRCYMNPPYGRTIGRWVEKAYQESLKGCTVICLLPARTDTKWFHNFCTKGEITFIKGRLKFGSAVNSAPFPSMIVVFRPAAKTIFSGVQY